MSFIWHVVHAVLCIAIMALVMGLGLAVIRVGELLYVDPDMANFLMPFYMAIWPWVLVVLNAIAILYVIFGWKSSVMKNLVEVPSLLIFTFGLFYYFSAHRLFQGMDREFAGHSVDIFAALYVLTGIWMIPIAVFVATHEGLGRKAARHVANHVTGTATSPAHS